MVIKSFLREIWGVAFFGAAKASNQWNFFRKNHIFRQFTKVFSLESFPLYGTNTSLIRTIILVSRLWSLSNTIWTVVTSWSVPYSEKLSREIKLSRISKCYGYLWNFSPQNLGAWHYLAAPVSNSRKFSPWKSYFLPIHKIFFSWKFPTVQIEKFDCRWK